MSDEQVRWLETGRLAELGLLASELIHELRQPAFAVKALSQLLQGRLQSPEKEQLELILSQVEVMEALLDRYAGSSRRPGVNGHPVLLGPVVTASVDMMRHRAVMHQRQLHLSSNGLETVVHIDPVAIHQIVVNLVTNAIDAAVRDVNVRVDGASIHIDDDGKGITAETAATMFEPFFTTKPPGKGTGLGLSVAKHLTTEAGGALTWQPLEHGTRFSISFPEKSGASEQT